MNKSKLTLNFIQKASKGPISNPNKFAIKFRKILLSFKIENQPEIFCFNPPINPKPNYYRVSFPRKYEDSTLLIYSANPLYQKTENLFAKFLFKRLLFHGILLQISFALLNPYFFLGCLYLIIFGYFDKEIFYAISNGCYLINE